MVDEVVSVWDGMGEWWRFRRFFRPMLAPMLAQRGLSLSLGIAGLAQLVLTLFHIGGMECPVMKLTGCPCPGCGLSRACAALVRGEVRDSLTMHAMAPLVLAAVVIFLMAGVLPEGIRRRLVAFVEGAERASGFVVLSVGLVFLYWLARLLYAPAEVISLLRIH